MLGNPIGCVSNPSHTTGSNHPATRFQRVRGSQGWKSTPVGSPPPGGQPPFSRIEQHLGSNRGGHAQLRSAFQGAMPITWNNIRSADKYLPISTRQINIVCFEHKIRRSFLRILTLIAPITAQKRQLGLNHIHEVHVPRTPWNAKKSVNDHILGRHMHGRSNSVAYSQTI